MTECIESAHFKIRRKMGKHKKDFIFCPNKIQKIEPVKSEYLDPPPLPRSGHRIIIFNGNLYAFGGYNHGSQSSDNQPQHETLFKELWKFNFAARTWKLLETKGRMPDELASYCAVLLNNNFLVYGGTGIPFGDTSSNSVHLCNLKSLKWTTLQTTGSKPSPQYGQAMAMHENKLYIVGGTAGYEYSIDVHCLNLSTAEWSLLYEEQIEDNSVPEGRYRHEIAILDDQIFVFGGGTQYSCFGFSQIPVFGLKDCNWKYISSEPNFPEARRCHGCVQIGSDVYICGGTDGHKLFKDVWKFNLKTFIWVKIAELPTNLFFHAVAVSDVGQMFIFGGVTNHRLNKRTNEIFSMWLKIPSLSEMCWQAIIQYIPDIRKLDKQKLFACGIPMYYLNQIDFEDRKSMEVSVNDIS